MSIEARNISKNFGKFKALDDVSAHIASGELVALLGPSGSGKTTLLRIIAGLEVPDAGLILFQGDDATTRSVKERRVGFVFQHYALFRHLTVFENVAFGLRVRERRSRPSNKEIGERVNNLLNLVQLDGMAQRYPAQLSGGQKQRVALARALAVEPKVLLLDEPFGALDAKVRLELRRWLRKLHDELHITSVFVTHDQEEALELADRIVILNKGVIVQTGTPEEVYDQPNSPFVYNFLGNVNLFHARLHQGYAHIGSNCMAAPEHAAALDSPAVGYVRAHDLEIQRTADDDSFVKASVKHIHTIGPAVRVELTLSDTLNTVVAEISRETYQTLSLQVGEEVFVKPRKFKVFIEDYQI